MVYFSFRLLVCFPKSCAMLSVLRCSEAFGWLNLQLSNSLYVFLVQDWSIFRMTSIQPPWLSGKVPWAPRNGWVETMVYSIESTCSLREWNHVSQTWISVLVILFNFCTVSEAPKASVAAKKFPSYNPDVKTDQQKKEEVSQRHLELIVLKY